MGKILLGHLLIFTERERPRDARGLKAQLKKCPPRHGKRWSQPPDKGRSQDPENATLGLHLDGDSKASLPMAQVSRPQSYPVSIKNMGGISLPTPST